MSKSEIMICEKCGQPTGGQPFCNCEDEQPKKIVCPKCGNRDDWEVVNMEISSDHACGELEDDEGFPPGFSEAAFQPNCFWNSIALMVICTCGETVWQEQDDKYILGFVRDTTKQDPEPSREQEGISDGVQV